MIASEPGTKTMELSEVRGQLDTLITRVHRKETRVIVEQGGVPVAAIVSTEDLARLDRLDRERAARFAVIDEVRAAFAGVPDEEIERETDRILGINQEDAPQPAATASSER